MARRRAPSESEVAQLNMTPMIDVVFQLLIFFMLVTELSRRQVEVLNLPAATQAIKEEQVDNEEVIVNIMPPGEKAVRPEQEQYCVLRVLGQDVNVEWLEQLFRTRRNMAIYQEIPGNAASNVKYPLLIRADRTVPWLEVQRIMMMATRYGGVYKVALGAKIPQGG